MKTLLITLICMTTGFCLCVGIQNGQLSRLLSALSRTRLATEAKPTPSGQWMWDTKNRSTLQHDEAYNRVDYSANFSHGGSRR